MGPVREPNVSIWSVALVAVALAVLGGFAQAHPQDGPHADLRAAIEPDGVRWSVGVNVAFLDAVLGAQREAPDRFSPGEREALKAAFERFLLEQVRVSIDGQTPQPRLENVRLDLDPDPQMVVLYPRMGMRALMRCSAVVVFDAEGMPEHVELTWPAYPVDRLAQELEPGAEVKMVLEGQVRAEGVVQLVRFSEADPTVEWSAGGIAARFLPTPSVPELRGGAQVGSLTLGLAGVTLVCGLWLLAALVRGAGRALPIVGLVLSATIGYAARGVAPIDAPWGGEPELPDAAFCEQVFRPLHLNMYRSFDYTDESDVYDALAGSVEGPLLEELYSQIYASLVQAEQGGMLGIITGIEPMELTIDGIRVAPVNGQEVIVFTATHRWRVDGTVYHWGHSHTRTIEYLARYEVAGLDEGWRFIDHEVLEQTRLDPGAGSGEGAPPDIEAILESLGTDDL